MAGFSVAFAMGPASAVTHFTGRMVAQRGFHPCSCLETLIQNGTASDNGTAGGTLNQSVLGFQVGGNPLLTMSRVVR